MTEEITVKFRNKTYVLKPFSKNPINMVAYWGAAFIVTCFWLGLTGAAIGAFMFLNYGVSLILPPIYEITFSRFADMWLGGLWVSILLFMLLSWKKISFGDPKEKKHNE